MGGLSGLSGMSGMSGTLGGRREPITQAFELTLSNAALSNEPYEFSPTLHNWQQGDKISFRARARKITLLGVYGQAEPADTAVDDPSYSAVYVNGEFLQLFSGTATDLVIWDAPADSWVEVEIRSGPLVLFHGPIEWVEIMAASPRVEYIPALGGLVSLSDFRQTKSQGTGNLTNRGTIYSAEMNGDGLGILFGGTPPDMATVSGWVNGSGGVAVAGYNSKVWGQVYNLTSGGRGAVREHIWRVPGTPTISRIFARQVSVAPSVPDDSGKVVVVTGTSIPATPDASTYDCYPDRLMNLVEGRLKVVNLAVGSSMLSASEGQGAPLFDTEANKTQIVATLQQAAAPILYISHIGNDMFVNNTDGSERTPADVKDKLVELVAYFKTEVPTLSKVLICEIETAYRAVVREEWMPALTDAVSEINAVHPSLAQLVDTDAIYATVSTSDGIHPDSAGAAQIAEHVLPYLESLL